MTLIEIFGILIVHWIADFILQSDADAKGKSVYMKHLVSHTFLYSLFWVAPLLIYSILNDLYHVTAGKKLHNKFYFVIITFILHTVTDYFTSRLNSKLWAAGKTHNFFVSIGFDQLLHYFQLFITFYIIFKQTQLTNT